MASSRPVPPRHQRPIYRRQVFAHLLALDCACPGCGRVSAGQRRAIRLNFKRKAPMQYGYDPVSGRFRCRACDRTWILGVIFWPVHHQTRPGRPVDTVPTLEEAIALREQSSRVVLTAKKEAKAPANVVEETPMTPPAIASTFAAKDPLLE